MKREPRLVYPEAGDECQHEWEPDAFGSRCYYCGDYVAHYFDPDGELTDEEFEF